MEDYLEKCTNIKVDIFALELLMEPEEAEVCLGYILKHAKRRGSGIFEIVETEGRKDHFVASRRSLARAGKMIGKMFSMKK